MGREEEIIANALEHRSDFKAARASSEGARMHARAAAAEGREFVYRPFLESVLAHGTPSIPVIRDILFGA